MGINNSEDISMLNITNTSNTAYNAITNNTNFPLRLFDNGTGQHSLLHFRQGSTGDVFIGALGDGTVNRADFIVKQDNDGTFIETLRIKHSGNVGIGTDNPLSRLHIHDTITGLPEITLSNTQGTTELSTVLTANQYFTGTLAGDSIFRTAAGKKIHIGEINLTPGITVDGSKIGIGKTTPERELDIIGELAVSSGRIYNESKFTFRSNSGS